MEDFDLSSEENQIAGMTSMEMYEGECSEELEELRRNEILSQDPEQSNAANPIVKVDEVNDARHVERIPRRVNEWFALIDQNRERESQGLEPIYPWESHLELSGVIEADTEITEPMFLILLGHYLIYLWNMVT